MKYHYSIVNGEVAKTLADESLALRRAAQFYADSVKAWPRGTWFQQRRGLLMIREGDLLQ